jgi:hypothetical protein
VGKGWPGDVESLFSLRIVHLILVVHLSSVFSSDFCPDIPLWPFDLRLSFSGLKHIYAQIAEAEGSYTVNASIVEAHDSHLNRVGLIGNIVLLWGGWPTL